MDGAGYLADRVGAWFEAQGTSKVYATAELAPSRCLVLLGEPGAGKTSVITANSPLLPVEVSSVPVIARDLGLYGSEDRVVRNLFECAEIDAGATVIVIVRPESASRWCGAVGEMAIGGL